MAECSFSLPFDPDWRCLHPAQEGKGLCRWHDPEVKKSRAEVEAAVAGKADLAGARLTGADLARADLSGAHLWGAHLWGAHLSGANLSGAELRKAYLRDVDLRDADLTGADLRDANLGMTHDLGGADLTGARLMGADLTGADLAGANLSGTHLRGAHLAGADLRGARLMGAYLAGADLSGADLSGKHELAGANLSGTHLRGAHLAGADLAGANLSGTDLRGAHLAGADLAGARLTGADLAEAHLWRADLREADLRRADLREADLRETDLREADLTGADLTRAELGWTILANCDLSEAKGLESVRHQGPSSIGVDTIFKSKGRIPGVFLRGTGVPEEFVRELPRLLRERRHYTSFICYGEPDRSFAEKLESDLRSRGVSCWAYFADATPGERTWREIGKNRREAEKMIVLCSAAALIRDGVLKEIEEQIDEDPDKMLPVSLDNLWKETGFRVMRASRDLKPFLLERNYADFSDPAAYENALSRLLRALQTSRKAVLAEGQP